MISGNKYKHVNNDGGIRWEKILVSIQTKWCKRIFLYGTIKYKKVNYIVVRGDIVMVSVNDIKNSIEPIAKHYGVKKVYLFGSYAKHCETEQSDIDLLIEKGSPMSLLKLSGMRQEVEEALGISVDLLTLSGIEDDFKKDIEGTEILIYEE